VLQKNQELEVLNKGLLADKQELEMNGKRLEENSKKFETDCTKLKIENETLDNDCKKFKAENERLVGENEKLVGENKQLQSNLEDGRYDSTLLLHTLTSYVIAMKNNALIQSDLNLRLTDLGREKFNVQQLQELLQGHKNVYQQLVEMVQKLPKEITEKLMGEESILAKILSSGNATEAK
jgi:chromosome segregation ATPase